MTIPELYDLYLKHPQVETDTRKLKPGDIYFALSGANFDGNDFVETALKQGASYAVTDRKVSTTNDRIIIVPDVLQTLQQLALFHRRHFHIPFIAITGSNGKTTTKELVNAVLSSHYTTYTTQGNLNNHIGIPLTLLRIAPDAQMAVIEMGANHQGEIAGYCSYVLPTHGIITNCGKAHLEGFGGIEGVRKGKGELYDYLRKTGGTVHLMNDLDYLVEMAESIQVVRTYGSRDAGVVGRALGGGTFLQVQLLDTEHPAIIPTQLVGDYNLPNVLCAVSVGVEMGVPMEKIIQAIAAYIPSNSRSQLVEWKNNHVILDAYNANPTSVKLAVENFATLEADKKVLLIGGMMELGADSVQEHKAIVEQIMRHKFDKVVLVGGDFEQVVNPYIYFATSAEAREWLLEQDLENAYLLIKGSRSIQMEKIVQ